MQHSSNISVRKRVKPPGDESPDAKRIDALANRAVNARAQAAHQQAKARESTGTSISDMIKKVLEQNGKKNQFNTANCFSNKASLDMYQPGDIESNDIPIQDAALLLDSSQQIYGYRVEKTHKDAVSTYKALIDGTVKGLEQMNAESEEIVNEDGTVKRRRKRKSLPEGSTLADILAQVRTADDDDNNEERDMEELIAKVTNDDQAANFEKPVWKPTDNYDAKLTDLHIYRQAKIAETMREGNVHCVVDDSSIEMLNTDIDWLQKNCCYQKALRGLESSQVNLLQAHGNSSSDGRVFYLHPRLVDNEKKLMCTENVDPDFVRSMNFLIEDGLSDLPKISSDLLIPDITPRPRLNKGTMVTRVDSRRTELSGKVGDQTILAGDVTVLVPQPGSSSSNATFSTSPELMLPRKTSSMGDRFQKMERVESFQPLPLSAITCGNDILEIMNVPKTLPVMKHIDDLIAKKEEMMNNGETDLWKMGINAEEWNESPATISTAIKHIKECQIDQYVRSMDLIAVGELASMRIRKQDVEKFAMEKRKLPRDEQKRFFPPEPQRCVWLRVPKNPSRANYPADPFEQEMRAEDDVDDFCVSEPSRHDETMEILANEHGEQNAGPNDMGVFEQPDDDFAGANDDDFDTEQAVDEYIQKVEQIGINEDHVTEAMDTREPQSHEEVVGAGQQLVPDLTPAAELQVRQLGKEDDAHWIGAREGSELKKKERAQKTKKKKADDYEYLFAPLTKEDLVQNIHKIRFVSSDRNIQKDERMVYMANRESWCRQPNLQYPLENLFKSVVYRSRFYYTWSIEHKEHDQQKEMTYERPGFETNELNVLTWINGFRNNKILIKERKKDGEDPVNESQIQEITALGEQDNGVDDDFGVLEPDHDMNMNLSEFRENTMRNLDEETRNRYQFFTITQDCLRQAQETEGFDDDDENVAGAAIYRFIAAKERDPEKQKREIRSILTDDRVTMPKILSVLNSLKKDQAPDPNVSISDVFPSTEPLDNVNPEEVLSAITEVHDYEDEDEAEAARQRDNQELPELRKKIRVNGMHTFKSAYVCLPHRNREPSAPAAFLNCALQLANESNLLIHQDRTKLNWMTDCLIYNSDEKLPDNLGNVDGINGVGEAWEATNDPCAVKLDEAAIAKIKRDQGYYDPNDPDVEVLEERPSSSRQLRPRTSMQAVVEEDEEEEFMDEDM